MVHRVLVAVDGSSASNAALEVACALADNYEAALALLTVAEPGEIDDDVIAAARTEGLIPSDASFMSVFDSYSSSSIKTEDRRVEQTAILASIIAEQVIATAKAYSRDKPFQAIKTFIESGDPARAILECADKNKADIIIMGHDQQGRIESLFKGSVANHVQREAKCPVLIYCQPAGD